MSVDIPISGYCDTRFLGVREEFVRNFAERGEVGAAACIFDRRRHGGRPGRRLG